MTTTAIPEFDDYGDLPAGIHAAGLNEIERRFGRFMSSERRAILFARLIEIVELARKSEIVERILIGGSFVTSKTIPNDIDLVLILKAKVTFEELLPSQYIVANRNGLRRVLKGDNFDVMVARPDDDGYLDIVEFFQTNRNNKRIGMVEVKL